MYESLVKWANLKVEYYPFISYDGDADLVYGPVVNMLAYIAGETRMIQDRMGRELTSNKQLYIEGKYVINENDKFVFDGKEHIVVATAPYYTKGKKDVLVVYL